MRIAPTWLFVVIVVTAFSCEISLAAQIAYDSAGDSAYNNVGSGLVPVGTNGGYGWGGGWSAAPPFGSYDLFIGSSSTNGVGDPTGSGDINSPRTPLGRAWRIRAPQSDPIFGGVSRPFNGALIPGQTFVMDFDNGSIPSGEEVDVELGGIALAAGHYNYVDYSLFPPGGTQPIDTGVAITDQGIHIELTVVDTSTTRFSLWPVDAPASGATFALGYTSVSSVKIVSDIPGPRADADVYLNNMAITPEPLMAPIWLIGAAGFLLGRRRLRLPG